jgi:hypothetical protein
VAELLPDGCEDLRDCPHLLFDAIRSALVILSFDELTEDERPPKAIWTDGEKLKAWFDGIKRRREEKYGAKGPGPIEDPVENKAARSLLAGG